MPAFGVRHDGVHYRVRPSAYAVVPDERHHPGALAVLRTPLGWFLPGGGRDEGESPADTVTREGVEEAGLRLEPQDVLGEAIEWIHAAGDASGWEKRCTFLVARVVGTTVAVEPDHVLEWIPVAEAALVLTPPTHRWAVERWIERGPGSGFGVPTLDL
jgi:8-oxo-dGTP diphosphatase